MRDSEKVGEVSSPRSASGLFWSLTPEKRAAALAYEGLAASGNAALPAAVAVRIVRRACGGWLATARRDGLGIGVTADTEPAARLKLAESWKRWRQILQATRPICLPHLPHPPETQED